MFILELQVLPVLRRSPEGSGAPMDFADAVLAISYRSPEQAYGMLCFNIVVRLVEYGVLIK